MSSEFKCKTCKKVFPTHYALNHHKFVVSKFCNEYAALQEKFTCKKCNTIFISKAALDIHTIMSLKCCPKELRKGVVCRYCDRKFVWNINAFTEVDINTIENLTEQTLSSHYKSCVGKFAESFDADEIIFNSIYQNKMIEEDNPFEDITDPSKLDTVIKTSRDERVIPFVKNSDNIVGAFKIKIKKKRLNQNKPKIKDPWD